MGAARRHEGRFWYNVCETIRKEFQRVIVLTFNLAYILIAPNITIMLPTLVVWDLLIHHAREERTGYC